MQNTRRNIRDMGDWGVPRREIEVIPTAAIEENIYNGDLSSSEEEITLDVIITKKPSTKVVRDFMRANLGVIESEEQRLFG